MNIFDLLFLCLILVSAVVLLTAVSLALSGRRSKALAIVRVYSMAAVAYFSVVILVSLLLPRRELRLGEAECFDDWCISITDIGRVPDGESVWYEVQAKIFSHALRATQRERNFTIYLTDTGGKRYNPVPSRSKVPFDVLLSPSESVTAVRAFQLPAATRNLKLVLTHEGGFPIGWFIIGYETWFRKPAFVSVSGSSSQISSLNPPNVP